MVSDDQERLEQKQEACQSQEDDELTNIDWMEDLESEALDDEQAAALIQDVLSQLADTEPTNALESGSREDAGTRGHGDTWRGKESANSLFPIPYSQSKIDVTPQKNWQQLKHISMIVPLLGATSVIAIALLGVWFFSKGSPRPQDLFPPQTETSAPDSQSLEPNYPVDLNKLETATLTAIAIEQFSQGKLENGQRAVEVLLDRGALPQAKAALATVSNQQLDNPIISFLSGRLAWQSVQASKENYNLLDAQRYWETAVKQQPDSLVYFNALGFAYYAEGNLDQANQAWHDALFLLEKQLIENQGTSTSQQALNTYAGLALGLGKLAQNQSGKQQTILFDKALKLCQKVVSDDPVNFQPDALGKNWMWSKQAIQDWQRLISASEK